MVVREAEMASSTALVCSLRCMHHALAVGWMHKALHVATGVCCLWSVISVKNRPLGILTTGVGSICKEVAYNQ